MNTKRLKTELDAFNAENKKLLDEQVSVRATVVAAQKELEAEETQPVSSKRKDLGVVRSINTRGYEVMVVSPKSFDESLEISKNLIDRKTVVLNLHLLDREQALRIVDFLCGATHALSGSQQKIGDSVFIFTPVNVALSAESQKSKFLRDALWNQPQV